MIRLLYIAIILANVLLGAGTPGVIAPAAEARETADETMIAADFGITIIGTIISKNGDNVALVKFKETGMVRALRLGFAIYERYKVTAIHANFMILASKDGSGSKITKILKDGFIDNQIKMTNGKNEGSNFNDGYKEDGFERSKNAIEMSEGFRDKLIEQDLPKILMQASAEPVIQNGQIMGFAIDQIEAGSIFAKAGLQNGDVITSINDISLQDVTATIKLLHGLKKAKDMAIEINRNGQVIPINVKVK